MTPTCLGLFLDLPRQQIIQLEQILSATNIRFMILSDFPCIIFRQLDEASHSVFRENVRLNEALKHHMKETEDLKKLTASLAKKNACLTLDKVCLNQRTANSGAY